MLMHSIVRKKERVKRILIAPRRKRRGEKIKNEMTLS
jgi:hypothetical protein